QGLLQQTHVKSLFSKTRLYRFATLIQSSIRYLCEEGINQLGFDTFYSKLNLNLNVMYFKITNEINWMES
ncbi:MAG: hypothetical protein B7Y48_09150, partial [Methylophilales bacterium 28-44-11]